MIFFLALINCTVCWLALVTTIILQMIFSGWTKPVAVSHPCAASRARQVAQGHTTPSILQFKFKNLKELYVWKVGNF